MAAVVVDDVNIARMLVQNRADVNARAGGPRNSALDLTAVKGRREMCALLLDAGVRFAEADDNENTVTAMKLFVQHQSLRACAGTPHCRIVRQCASCCTAGETRRRSTDFEYT